MNRWIARVHKDNRAFTIIELLVVIIVISILATLVIVGYGAVTGSANDTAVKSDLTKIDDAFKQYALDHNGVFPWTVSRLESLDLDLTQDSYETNNLANVYVCLKSNHKEYAVIAMSRSGKRFVITSEHGISEYAGVVSWSDSDANFNETCASIDATYLSTGISGFYEDDWLAWADGSETIALTCPDNYIVVPGSNFFGTSDFCVMKYEARDTAGVATSTGSGAAWVNVTQAAAATAGFDACNGCHLIADAEWLTIAENVANVASNWTGGSVGSGSLYIGHTDNSPASALTDAGDGTDGYLGTGNTTGSNQRRTLTLSNGEVIWDFSGNYAEWSAIAAGPNQSPGVASDVAASWRDWNTSGFDAHAMAEYILPVSSIPAASSWTRSHGIGGVYSNYNDAFARVGIRGGYYNDGTNAGVFSLNLSADSSYSAALVGFRTAGVPDD